MGKSGVTRACLQGTLEQGGQEVTPAPSLNCAAALTQGRPPGTRTKQGRNHACLGEGGRQPVHPTFRRREARRYSAAPAGGALAPPRPGRCPTFPGCAGRLGTCQHPGGSYISASFSWNLGSC